MLRFLQELIVNVALTTPLVGAYAMFALGIVFIYRASRVLNLAHGAMAMFPAYVSYSLAKVIGVFPAAVVALAIGGALGLAVERFVVRRLRSSSETAQTVGTVAVLGILIAVTAQIWGTSTLVTPKLFPDIDIPMGESVLSLSAIGVFIVALGVTVGFFALFRYSDLGLAMRAAADNRRASALVGINPDRTTAMAWFFAGLLAALGGVLLASATRLNPFILSLQVLPAFVAALIGGLESIAGAAYGSAVVGLVLGIVPTFAFGKSVGVPQVALALLAFLVMSLRGKRFSASDVRSGL